MGNWILLLVALSGVLGGVVSCSHSPSRSLGREFASIQDAGQQPADWTFKAARQLIESAPKTMDGPVIVSRQVWDPGRTTGSMSEQKLSNIHTLVIHNTETPENDERALQSVINLHLGKRGWADIGYHYLIARDSKDGRWKVYEGRPIDRVGAHAGVLKGADGTPLVTLNDNTLGIAVVGTYAWRTEAKRQEMMDSIPVELRGTPEGEQRLIKILANYPEPTAPEAERQPPQEAVQELLRLVHSLISDPRMTGLFRIRSHGALAARELRPDMTDTDLFNLAINPYHTDCAGHGMIHIIEALQKRYRAPFQSFRAKH